MRKAALILLLLLSALLLGGCSTSQQVENQAYVIVLGIDRSKDGGIELSTQIPKVSGSQDSGGSGASGSYLPISVRADSYEQAIERLSWALPRDINLSQLEMIVLSKELVQEDGCAELIRRIANTEHIYTAAGVVICEGRAEDFVTALSPKLGSRLSADISATLDHYRGLGIIPSCSLANLYYLSNAAYSDPMTAYAVLDKQPQAQNQQQAFSSMDSAAELSQSYESGIETRYCGAAIFSGGMYMGVFSGDAAILASLLNNSLDSFRYICGGESLEFRLIGAPEIRVDTDASPVKISIGMRLSVEAQENMPGEEIMRSTLTEDMLKVINAAQDMRAEPFGFSGAAAGHFLTLEEWQEFDWKQRFQEAEIEIKLNFGPVGT